MDTQPDYPSPEHLARIPSSRREPSHVSSQGKEAASVTHDIYITCAGTNTQQLIDLLEMMFGDLDEPDLKGLETETMKQMRAQAEADIISAEGTTSKGGVTKIMVTSLPVKYVHSHPSLF